MLEGPATIDVKQRAGCLSYSEDPHGFRSLLARTLTAQSASSWSVPVRFSLKEISVQHDLFFNLFFIIVSFTARVCVSFLI